ncbi:MAG: hypothetical protein DLM69_04340 [Candidatus Chloroheliales bacterium]|nr:MAG: hypothetical protein DLM69_04340 [Chloroflexota bacterium]
MKPQFSLHRASTSVALLLIAIMMLGLAGCDTSSPAAQGQAAQLQPTIQPQANGSKEDVPDEVVHNADFGTWNYVALKNMNGAVIYNGGKKIGPGDIYAMISYKVQTDDGVRSYMEANRKLIAQVAKQSGQAEVYIYFSPYLPVDQFRSFAQAHGLSIAQSFVRATRSDPNTPYTTFETMGFGPHQPGELIAKGVDPIPQLELEGRFSQLTHDFPGLELKGVFYTRAWVNTSELPAITANAQVYYLDVTANVVRSDLAAAGIPNANNIDVENNSLGAVYDLVEHPSKPRK